MKSVNAYENLSRRSGRCFPLCDLSVVTEQYFTMQCDFVGLWPVSVPRSIRYPMMRGASYARGCAAASSMNGPIPFAHRVSYATGFLRPGSPPVMGSATGSQGG